MIFFELSHLTLFLTCTFGIFTNSIVVSIYYRLNTRTKIQNFNMICSVLHIIYLAALAVFNLLNLGIFDLKNNRLLISYELFIDDYLLSSLAISIICVQIYIFTQHYVMISNKKVLLIQADIR
jgi:hypothetical protein